MADAPIQIDVKVVTQQATAALSGLVDASQKAAAGIVSSFEKAGNGVSAAVTKMETASNKIAGVWSGIVRIFVADQIVKGLENVALGADKFHDSLAIAANTAHNLGKAFDESQVHDWLEAFSTSAKGGGYSLQELADGVQQFASVGAKGAQAERLTAIATEFAAGKTHDYGEAVSLLTKVLTGHVALLGRYGIAIKDANGKTLDAVEAINLLEKSFTGDAEKRATSLAGQIGILSNEVFILKEQFAAILAPILAQVVSWMDKLVKAFESTSPQMKQLITYVTLAAAGLAILGLVIGPIITAFEALGAAVAILTDPIILVIAAIVGLVWWIDYVKNHAEEFYLAEQDMLNRLAQAWHAAITFIVARIEDWGTALVGVFLATHGQAQAGLKLITSSVQDSLTAWSGLFSKIGDGIKYGFETGYAAAKKAALDAYNYFKALFTTHKTAGLDYSVPNDSLDNLNAAEDATGTGKKKKKSPYPEFQGPTTTITASALPDPTVAIANAYKSGAVINAQLEAVRVQRGTLQASGKLTPEKDAGLKAQEAQLQEQLAKLNLVIAQSKETLAKYEVQTAQATGNKQNEIAAEAKVVEAHRAVYQAETELGKAAGNVTIAMAELAAKAQQLPSTIQKLMEQFNLLISPSTNLAAWWEEIAQRSIAVREALTIVGNLFTLIARILDAVLVPVIHVLNFVLTDLANIVIDVWNVFATLLNALGLHVDYLKHVNSLLGDLGNNVRPLIDIIHDIPTLKEFGAGKWGPLQPDQYGSNDGGLLTSQQQQSTFLQKIIGVLGLIFALDWLTHSKFYADMSAWFTQTWAKGQQQFNSMSQQTQKMGEGIGLIAIGTLLLSGHAKGILGFIERLVGLALIAYGIMLIMQGLHAAHLAIATTHLAVATTQLGVLTAIEGTLIAGFATLGAALTLNAALSWLPCPSVDQLMETKEHGFIRAGDLKVGMHLRAPNGAGWNRINSVRILPTTIVRSNNAEESIDVNWNHFFKDTRGQWVLARELNAGDELMRDGGGTVKILDTVIIGPGHYAAIDCENHEYVIGTTMGHNDSGSVAAQFGNAAANLLGNIAGPVAKHIGAIANSPGGVASAANRVLGGAGGGGAGGVGVIDNSTQVSQDVHIGQVNEAANLEEIMAALSIESVFFGSGRRYQQGYQGI